MKPGTYTAKEMSERSALSVLYLPTTQLFPHKSNARTHSKRQIRQIADSIKVFSFTNPVLIDRKNTIIAGHGRVEAAKLLGMIEVPTIRLEGLSEDQIRAYILADNKLAENAGWDRAILAIELQHLLTIDSDIDVSITGFEVAEIDILIEKAAEPVDEADVIDLADQGPAVTQAGDIWHLGKHRLLCGSSLEEQSFGYLLGQRKADLVFCDPPFNVAIDGHATGNGAIKHRPFAMASGEMTEVEFTQFLALSLGLLARHSKNGSIHFVCMDWRHLAEINLAGKQVYDALLNVAVWVKDNGGMGSFYRSRHEMIFIFRNGKEAHSNNIQLGRFGRYRTNVWNYPGVNTMSKQGDEGNLLAFHPTCKPIAMVADAILDCSARGNLVVDSFLGSGTTLLAAERVGRVCAGIEIDPFYVDVAIRRWQKLTGDLAVQVSSGRTFDAIAEEVNLALQ